jgi:hypothetical protein
MKQVMLLFLCVVAVLLLGSAMQKGNLDFGPVAAVEESLPQETANTAEELRPDMPPGNGDEARQAKTDVLRFGDSPRP